MRKLTLMAAIGMAACLAFAGCAKEESSKKSATADSTTEATTEAETTVEDVTEEETEEIIDEPDVSGGFDYTGAIGNPLSDDVQAAFDAAFEEFTGGSVTPVALLAQQVVAGMNYRILCVETTMTNPATTDLKIAEIYVDTDGNSSLSGIYDVYLYEEGVVDSEPADGGYYDAGITTEAALTDDLQAIWDSVYTGEAVGATVKCVAYLGSQIVAGTNYLFVVELTPVVEDAVSTMQVVTLYQDLDGNVVDNSYATIEIAAD